MVENLWHVRYLSLKIFMFLIPIYHPIGFLGRYLKIDVFVSFKFLLISIIKNIRIADYLMLVCRHMEHIVIF